MSDGDCVQVALRIRPLVKTEIDKGCQEILDRIPGEPQVIVKNHDSYTFNYVFAKEETQEIVYEESVQSMIEKLFKGYNVTILAYGQTGSGKTHTMGTLYNGEKSSEMGVIPRAMHDIFSKVSEMSESYQVSVSCSFMELYQETLYDLLTNSSREQSSVDIREDVNKGIVIPGLTEISVKTAEETTNCLIKGSAGRAVGATAMNEQSSRSHAIFTININISSSTSSMISAKFNLVDLAGSERPKKTKATGDRFKEGININKGLLALGNVISALGSGQNSYVCYRDSKLTRLLQDSLGGNSITLMIACISPADYNLDETISTLRYADRARKIKNKPVVNIDPEKAEINKLNNIIQNLRLQLLGRGNGSLSNIDNIENNSDSDSQQILLLKKQNFDLTERNQQLRQQLQATLTDLTEIESRASIAEETHEKLLNKFNEVKKLLNRSENNDNKICEEQIELNKIRTVINEMDKIFRESQEELMSQKTENNSMSDVTFCVQLEDVQRYDQFTTKQLEINSELRKINRELALKESHHQKVSINLTKFCDYQGSSENLIKESELKIQGLEAEKSDLLDKLKSVKENVTAKIAEERRKRLQQLEHEILDMRKRIIQQDKLLKVREKEAQKIMNLNNEIQQMKAARVNLIKSMKKEAEAFRQWKFNREKQLTQLKEKDRKRQNEMARMEALHNKQKNVLKRKVEEAMAINKRLKDVLDKQKQVQIKRNATNNPQSGKMDQILTLIDHELELILSVVDAQNTLDQLMEDRAAVNNRLKELKLEKTTNKNEIKSIENDLSLRNAQIDDIQQKILSSDIMGKIKVICDGVSSLPEARGAMKHLFNALIDLRREYAAKDNKIEEYKSACESVEEKVTSLEKIIHENKNKYREDLSTTEKNYEEKITVLLRELYKQPQQQLEDTNDPEVSERIQIQQEALDKIDSLREELECYKKKCNEYQTILKSTKRLRKTTLNGEIIKEETEDDMEKDIDFIYDELDDDELYEEDDPDWAKSPMFKRVSRGPTKKSMLQQTLASGVKRNSDGLIKCGCKKNCMSKRCGCRLNSAGCNERCSCDPELCENKTGSEKTINSTVSSSASERTFITDDKENVDLNREKCRPALNETVNISDNTDIKEELNTPKKFKLSIEEEENKLDVTTPIYPFKLKKRKPFYQ